MSKENSVKAVTLVIFIAVLALIHVLNPDFYGEFWHVATSGNMQETVDYIDSFGAWAMVFSFLLDVLINALGFLPSIFVSTANGLLFGIVPGIIVSWLAETVGVIISFILMRTILRSSAEKLIAKSKYLQKADDFSGRNGFKIMLILRAMPYFPSGILTALGAVSKISLRDYALANLIGKFPSTSLEVVIGHDVVNYQQNLDRLMIVIVLVCIIYGAIWYYHRRMEKK
ncbi:TVP38/TMEM64 family protein [Megamonas hypermegale]|uniref:TVP38/TMEM64 family membrane protein n=1 Tax=Megamonas hypermegale TaxID=158847 RepID=A0A921L7A6_9FIRM|nr:TVP38/TMEM64 family protein [Megamonas hypermegale]HJF84312.1 TVP38/TMEM64 family protein [Megamonas hypermegale]